MKETRAWLLWCIAHARAIALESCGSGHLALRTVAFDKALIYIMSAYRPDGPEYELELQKAEASDGQAHFKEAAASDVPAPQ